MNTKSDWQTVNRELMEERRRELGPPPSVEELLAYTRGELSQEEEERVRELLVCYPELARGLTEPFPEEDAQPGEPGYVSDEEMARRWTALQSRVAERRRGGRLFHFSRLSAAIAATVVVLFGAALWRAQTHADRPRIVGAQEELALTPQLLEPEGRRGIGSTAETVESVGKPVLLQVPLIDQYEIDRYRIRIVDSARPELHLWQSDPVQIGAGNAFRILIPGDYLQPGRYHILVYDADGENAPPLRRYAIRVR